MNYQFKKALNLAKRTGDKIIVFDNIDNADSAYVVMNLNEYEKMLISSSDLRGLTEEELIDKINRDIAIWKSQQEFADQLSGVSGLDDLHYSAHSEIKGFKNPDMGEMERQDRTRKRWTIPQDRKEAAEEVIEEDRQYLEEITF